MNQPAGKQQMMKLRIAEQLALLRFSGSGGGLVWGIPTAVDRWGNQAWGTQMAVGQKLILVVIGHVWRIGIYHDDYYVGS